jgi:putative component of membrane protein insertase Oxa1/YidC/SpoIIIJ protein YidD
VPSPFNLPPACRFQPRCPYSWERCSTVAPEIYQIGTSGRGARCHLHTPEGAQRLPAALEQHRQAMQVGRQQPGEANGQ